MKKYMKEFVHRGMFAFGFGPVILAVVYLCLQNGNVIQSITINEACLGIFSTAALAFVIGGANTIYQIEEMPVMVAALIHGSILYVSYIAVYLVNGWLIWGVTPILVFTGIFIVGYFVILAIIVTLTKKRTARLNELLKKKQEEVG